MAEVASWQAALGIIATVLVTNGGQFAMGGDTRKTASESVLMGAACREMLEASRAREESLFKELLSCARECTHVQSEHVAGMNASFDSLLEESWQKKPE